MIRIQVFHIFQEICHSFRSVYTLIISDWVYGVVRGWRFGEFEASPKRKMTGDYIPHSHAGVTAYVHYLRTW